MKIKSANVTINVLDIDTSISFYESLGLTVTNRWGNHYAQLQAPGMTIGLHPTKSLAGHSGNISLGFTVEQFAEAQAELEKKSVRVTPRQEEGGKFLHFTDPDGNALYLIEPKW